MVLGIDTIRRVHRLKLPRSVRNEQRAISLLKKYKCPVPYHEVRTRFLGHIAAPSIVASPVQTVKDLWGGNLPAAENLEALNDLFGVLMNDLWNSLTRHQKRTEPFRLIRTMPEPSRAGLAAYALLRQQEIDGFVEGLFNGLDEIDLPERAEAALNTLSQMRAMLAGLHALTLDETKAISDEEFATTLKQVEELTPIIEREINAIVLACTRARRQMLKNQDFSGPSFH